MDPASPNLAREVKSVPIAEVKSVVLSAQGIQDLWAQAHASVAAVGPWAGVTVHLYKNNVDPTPLTTETDLGEVQVADWAEYLAITTTGWGAPETRGDGSVLAIAAPVGSWVGPAAGGGPTIYGCYLKSPLTGTHYLAACPFVSPVGMVNSTKVLDVLVPMLLQGGPFTI